MLIPAGATVINHKGNTVICYGDLKDDSNFEVICDDEWDDECWCDGNPDGDSFTSWQQVVEGLWDHFGSDIQEITAV